MKIKLLTAVVCMSVVAMAANHPDFSGAWRLNSDASKNLGMMSQMNMTQAVTQSGSALDVTTHTSFQGRDDDSKTHYDLTGQSVTNELPLSGPSDTITKWEGSKLVTTWTSQSAVAGGPKVVRIETRTLSPDRNTMTVESVRGTSPAIVMVFEKK